jgi:hypothetical protein
MARSIDNWALISTLQEKMSAWVNHSSEFLKKSSFRSKFKLRRVLDSVCETIDIR